MPSNPSLPDGYGLLSPFTRRVLGIVNNTAIPEGWEVGLSADSTVILRDGPRWAALRFDSPCGSWGCAGGNIAHIAEGAEYDSLDAAVAAVTATPPVHAIPSIMEEVIASLSSGEASARAISVITANVEGADFELTVDLFNQIFNECTPGQVIAFYTSLASAGAVLTKLLGAATGVAPESILQSWAVSQQQQGPSSGS